MLPTLQLVSGAFLDWFTAMVADDNFPNRISVSPTITNTISDAFMMPSLSPWLLVDRTTTKPRRGNAL